MTQERGQEFSRLLTHPLKYFFDRTVMAKYPPGSIFKPAVSLAGMQEGVIDPDGGFNCSGGYFYAGRLYKCHHSGHLNGVVDAIAHSCNTYYMNKYRDIIDHFGYSNPQQGLDAFNKYLIEFGFTGKNWASITPMKALAGFPLRRITTSCCAFKKLGGWHSPTIMSCGIGQANCSLLRSKWPTFACLANRGYWYPPHLAMKFDGTAIPDRFYVKHEVHVDRRHFDTVVEGMAQCVTRGTARIAQVPGVEVCGKTGTSQNPHGDDHSVFFAFAPKENPKIAIAVYVENAGWGT